MLASLPATTHSSHRASKDAASWARRHGRGVIHATGVADGKISLVSDGICTPSGGAACFPTTGTRLSQIVSFATGHTTFPDANALAIEVKSAWVAAAGLPNLASYITMNATIPTYNPSVPPPAGTKTLIATGQQTVQLALVGMHVVGSAAGHPEMIWATFEHVNNAPAGIYSYINSSNSTVPVNQNVSLVPTIGGSSAPWLFSSTSATLLGWKNSCSRILVYLLCLDIVLPAFRGRAAARS